MRTLRGSRSVCLRETALTLTVVGVELQEQLQEEQRNQVDIFNRNQVDVINVGASSELRSMGCLPPPHSDSGSPLSDRGWSATAAQRQRRRTSPSRAPPRTPSSLAGACRSHGGGTPPARPSHPRCCQWQFARKSKFAPGLAVFEPQFLSQNKIPAGDASHRWIVYACALVLAHALGACGRWTFSS